MGQIRILDLEYNETNEEVPDTRKKDPMCCGYFEDEAGDIYAAGSSERRNKWGDPVSHQDSRSFPGKRGLENT